jgi:hypothetical protein
MVTRAATGHGLWKSRPSADLLRARDERIAADTRDPAAMLLGDPAPGRSALDAKLKKETLSEVLSSVGTGRS